MNISKLTDSFARGVAFSKRAYAFLRNDIWLLQARQVKRHWWAVRTYRFFGSVLFAFRMNRFALHASALTYYTLMSVVPVLALALTLARAFGGDDMARARVLHSLDTWLDRLTPEVVAETEGAAEAVIPEATHALADQLHNIVAGLFDQVGQFSFSTLGGIGAVALVFMVITMLGRIEESFNMIWGIEQTRSVWRKFSDYLSVVIIFPFFLLAATTVPILDLATRTAENVAYLGPYMNMMLHSVWMKHTLTIGAVTLAFMFVLIFMPNTRVKLLPGLAGGFVTGICFMLWLLICAHLQIGIAKNNALYGGFALLPILLLWIYTSWLIVLLGAEITFALQNGDTCHVDFRKGVSARARFLLSMALCREAGLCMKNNSMPFDPLEFARKHGISTRFIMHTIEHLVQQKWLVKVEQRGEAYLPCRDFSALTIADLASWIFNEGYTLRMLGLDELDTRLLDAGDRIHAALHRELKIPLLATEA